MVLMIFLERRRNCWKWQVTSQCEVELLNSSRGVGHGEDEEEKTNMQAVGKEGMCYVLRHLT